LVPATIVSQRYPEVKISNRSSTANRASAAQTIWSWKDFSSGKILREARRIGCRYRGGGADDRMRARLEATVRL